MSAITVSADGAYVLVALEDMSGGAVVGRAVRSADFATWTPAYRAPNEPANVKIVPSNPNSIFFHGNFDTDVLIILHSISAETNTDISPTSLGAKVCNTLESNPSGGGEAWATIDTDQDLLRTQDAGTTWAALDAALGFDATALEVLWSGGYALDRAFIAGKPASVELQYTPSEGADKEDQANAGLAAVANICSIIAIPA